MKKNPEISLLNLLLHKTVIVLLWQRLGSGDAQTTSHSLLPGAILYFLFLLLPKTYASHFFG